MYLSEFCRHAWLTGPIGRAGMAVTGWSNCFYWIHVLLILSLFRCVDGFLLQRYDFSLELTLVAVHVNDLHRADVVVG